jgi:hypothetical protein
MQGIIQAPAPKVKPDAPALALQRIDAEFTPEQREASRVKWAAEETAWRREQAEMRREAVVLRRNEVVRRNMVAMFGAIGTHGARRTG